MDLEDGMMGVVAEVAEVGLGAVGGAGGRLWIQLGDCLAVLPTLPARSVQCCVTSPPYWGLRDYGTAQWEGGDAWCEHSLFAGKSRPELNGGGCSSWSTRDATPKSCKCGARRIDSQLGLEATPEEYITEMVAVFREVRRVLRDDGTLWLNMGDSYAAAPYREGESVGRHTLNGRYGQVDQSVMAQRRSSVPPGLKPKDLCGIPWRLAFALQADGWYLRSDIIWHKPNPMPESVTDRPTKAHEYIFLLTKAERYFYDSDAIREKTIREGDISGGNYVNSSSDRLVKRFANPLLNVPEFRNKRTVWTIATQPYSEAHFATFPEEIPKLCILAGSKPGDTVLDPFAGSGTVGQVALELGRRAVLIELNPAYIELGRERTNVTPGFF